MLDLQKSCKDSTEFLYTLHPASSNDNISHNHSIVFKIKKLTWIDHYSFNYKLYPDFTSFPTDTFFLFQDPIQDTALYLVVLSPQSPLICDHFSTLTCFL